MAVDLTDNHKMKLTSKDVIVTDGVDMMIVKVNKSDRRFRWSQAKIITNNGFQSSIDKEKDQVIEKGELKDNEGIFEIFSETICEIYQKKVPKRRKHDLIKTEAKPRNIKKTKSLKKFESKNPVSILENNEEEEEDIKRLEIVKMKKMLLKRCRNCHFKKRSCMVDRSSCSALQKKCFACKQRCHFPKSLNCKKLRKNKK